MKKRNAGKMLIGLWLALALLLALAAGAAAEGQAVLSTKKLQNGSFEEGQTWTNAYSQVNQNTVPGWKTTATDDKIELFRKNKGTYIKNVTLKPADGDYAAELNADEESTLYQVLETEPSSIYEWSLYHGSRTSQDTMALIIGPKQGNDPEKPGRNERDQFMQMVDWWVNESGEYRENDYTLYDSSTNGKLYKGGTPVVIYTKKFGPNGTFENNEANNAFSMTPSTIHTEEWHIWLMRDTCTDVADAENPWTRYGAKSDVQSGANQQGSANGVQSEYYRYRVPAGQTESIFAFVSVDSAKGDNTFGNFLDCVNFEIYHHVTASRTAHGTAKVAAKKVDSKGNELFKTEMDVPQGSKVSADVPDGAKLTLTATTDSEDSVFAGVYRRGNGADPVFIPSSDVSKWTATVNADGTKTYVYDDTNANGIVVNNACDLHFVFVKSPTITYDPNGGDAYDCGQDIPGDPGKAANVYSFKPNTSVTPPTLVGPYTSHKPTKTTEGVEDTNWLFTGWMLMDDVGTAKMLEDPDGVHQVACNYSFQAGSAEGTILKQLFLVVGNEAAFSSDPAADPQKTTIDGIEYPLYWSTPAGAEEHYNQPASGLTFIAQWKWKQKYTPKLKTITDNRVVYVANANAGVIEVGVEVTENGNKTVQPVGEVDADGASKYYFAGAQETMYVEATAKTGYEFEGWYEGDTLVTTNRLLRYTVGREDVLTYEARFVGTVTQNYIRQIKDSNGIWVDVPQDNADVPALTPVYSYQVGPGTPVSCTAKAGTDKFAFIGWYEKDASGDYKAVDHSILANNGRTLSYEVTGDATYYARFVPKVYFEVRFVDSNGATSPSPAWGEACGTVSPVSVTQTPGENIASTASANPGYDFKGWYTSDGADWQSTECGESSRFETPMPAESCTYYAMFAARDDSHYSVEHIKMKPEKKPDGSSVLKPVTYKTEIIANVLTGKHVQAGSIDIPGYTYKASVQGVDNNGNTTTYTSNPEGDVLGSGGLVLKLYYAPNDVPYRIEYYWLDANGNETLKETDDTKTAQTDETVRLEESSKLLNRYASDGYVYAAGYGRNKLEGVVTADPMLVLKVYYSLKPCTVKFVMDEGGILGEHGGHVIQVPDQTVAYGGLATRPEDPLDYTDGAYEFERWEWENDAGNRETYSFYNPVTRDTLFLYAVWSKVHEVRYHMQGHGDQVPTEKVKNGEKATQPANPTAEGYSFRGWYTEETYENLFNKFDEAVTSDIDLYAKWTANVTVTKVWQDSADHSDDSVRVQLLKGGVPYENMPDAEQLSAEGTSVPQSCEQELNGTNSWTHTWTNLPADEEYTVVEDIPQDYTAVYSEVSANSWKITNVQDRHLEATIKNTHTSDTIDMVVRKEWQDANNRNRPGSVRVQIKNGGTGDVVGEGELNSNNNWTWSVAGLPKRENGGKTVSYIVEEVGVNPGYRVSCDIVVREDGSYTVTLTNVLTGKLDISGEKLWSDDGNRDGMRPDHVQLKIYQNAIADANLVRIMVVKPQSGEENTDRWTWTIEDLPLYDSFGTRNVYFVVEDPVPAGYTDPGPMRVPERDWGS